MCTQADRDFERFQRCAEKAFGLWRVTHAMLLGNLANRLMSDTGATDPECETIGELATRYERNSRVAQTRFH